MTNVHHNAQNKHQTSNSRSTYRMSGNNMALRNNPSLATHSKEHRRQLRGIQSESTSSSMKFQLADEPAAMSQ